MGYKYILLLVCLLCFGLAFAQRVGINTDGSVPNANAILDIKAFDKGVLFPRMNTTTRLSIPATRGLMVFDTSVNNLMIHTGQNWQSVSYSSSIWLLGGNANISENNFLGTTNARPLRIKVGNQVSGYISSMASNTFWGYLSGSSIDAIASGNTGNGFQALQMNKSGNDNTAYGVSALKSNTMGHFNTASGSNALVSNTEGYNNTAVGGYALYGNNTGNYNTALGSNALQENWNGNFNTGVGSFSLNHLRTGSNNTAIGTNALNMSNGSFNTAVGVGVLYNIEQGDYNTSLGALSMGNGSTYSAGNTAIGYRALYMNRGDNNDAVGILTMEKNTSGYGNVALGSLALRENVTGAWSTAVGQQAASTIVTGDENVAIGKASGMVGSNSSLNTFVGAYAGSAFARDVTNSTVIGRYAIVDASNKIRLGNSGVTVIEGAAPYSHPSDGRFKSNVVEDIKGLDFILQLRPVSYQFDARGFDQTLQQGQMKIHAAMEAQYQKANATRQSGFIAQEVEKAMQTSGYAFSGLYKPADAQGYYSLSYESFIMPLVKGMQEQQQQIEQLKAELQLLKKMLSVAK